MKDKFGNEVSIEEEIKMIETIAKIISKYINQIKMEERLQTSREN